jgi:hypothetical protein
MTLGIVMMVRSRRRGSGRPFATLDNPTHQANDRLNPIAVPPIFGIFIRSGCAVRRLCACFRPVPRPGSGPG